MRPTHPLAISTKTYSDAIKALNSLQSNYANIKAIRESGIRKNEMALLEMKEWVRRIGYSATDLNRLNVIHITGTKGKGSTAAFTSSILNEYRDKLHKIGLYTSPHLRNVRERIRINGEPISEEVFAKYFFEVWEKLDSTTSPLNEFPHMLSGAKPGYFKFLTLLSFHVFLQEGCKTCVYEVGIGGAYDSTNIVEKPLACGVSQLGIDHTFVLGDTIEEIAWNKGGIFKEGVPAFTVSGQPPNGLRVLQERATERHTVVKVVPEYARLKKEHLGISGDFQRMNASLSVALASQALRSLGIPETRVSNDSDSVIPEKFVNGLHKTKWEGRCQKLVRGGNSWYLDGAHTKESIEASSAWFRDTAQNSSSPKVLIFNQQGRDPKALIRYLHDVIYQSAHFDFVIFTTNVTWSSGTYADDLVSINVSQEDVKTLRVQNELREEWKKLDQNAVIYVSKSIEEAIKMVDKLGEDPLDIFVTGSLHLVGGVLVVFDGESP